MSGVKIESVGVVGGGLMGSGIAQVSAVAGLPTVIRDVGEAQLAKSRAAIEGSLAKLVEKGKVSAEQRDGALGRLRFTTDLDAVAGNDLVIEAIFEDLEVKNALWRDLDGRAPATSIFATNTSSLTVAAMAAVTKRPTQFVGLHFFSPVPLMALVEVVRTVTTSPAVFDAAFAWARRIGKEPIAAKDSAGFVVNLLLIPYMLDAVRALEHGVASVEDLDKAMKLGCNHPMGPLTLADFTGLDVCYNAAEILFKEFRETRYAPPPLLKRLVLLGHLGRKTGRGFYDYSVNPPAPANLGI
ncbi:MAG: 3-hydroxybutyryl-CoA dehydrogenase [Gemmatimonadales bacterium]|nr:3-hydroxybutyryl-CoA dehydrogenase [Gemmatimonadales bacterium]